MVEAKKYGLLLVMMEPPEEMEEEFNEWYDTEHIPEREAVPGILSAQRFVVNEGFPRYLALYDLESIEVLQSESYKRIGIDNLSPWSRRIIRSVRGSKRNVYEQTLPGAAKISKEANALVLWAYDIDASEDSELNQWYDTECISHLKKMDGFINLRRFICVEGFPKHLTLLDFKEITFLKDEADKKALLFQETIKFKKYFKGTIYNLYRKYIKK
jgi:hypothetical protein